MFTPLAIFRFQPFPTVAFLGVDVDITFHHTTSQFSALASGVGRLCIAQHCLALLAGLACCSQISALAATTCSHPRQSTTISSSNRRRWRSHPITEGVVKR